MFHPALTFLRTPIWARLSFLVASSVSSKGTTASAPGGSGAPVIIRKAVPGPTPPTGILPAATSPTTRSKRAFSLPAPRALQLCHYLLTQHGLAAPDGPTKHSLGAIALMPGKPLAGAGGTQYLPLTPDEGQESLHNPSIETGGVGGLDALLKRRNP